METNKLSYESCEWYIKIWRTRWYLYAILLYIKEYINPQIWVDMILEQDIDDDTEEEIRKSWKDIKKHVELSKMYKFSVK